MPQQKQAPALLAPLSEVPQRVASAQVQEVLQFKGLQQALYPATTQFRWTYTGTPTEAATSTSGVNTRRMVPWLVSRTVEVDQVGLFPDGLSGTPATPATTLTGVWRSHPTTFYPDGPPILEGAIVVAAAPAAQYSVAVGEHVLEAGLYWVGFTSSVTFPLFGARYLPMGVNAMADTNLDLLNYTATSQPAGVLYNAGPLGGAGLDVSGLVWQSTAFAPLMTVRLRPT